MALVMRDGVAYRVGDMVPHDCEECDCTRHRWNLAPSALRTDPPSTCTCGHPTFRHRFRPVTFDQRTDQEERWGSTTFVS